MYKLVSDIKGSRWSFLNGYYIFSNVVWLSSLEEVNKYTLIDENGKEIDIDINDFIVKAW